jgi:hypothetical protein
MNYTEQYIPERVPRFSLTVAAVHLRLWTAVGHNFVGLPFARKTNTSVGNILKDTHIPSSWPNMG